MQLAGTLSIWCLAGLVMFGCKRQAEEDVNSSSLSARDDRDYRHPSERDDTLGKDAFPGKHPDGPGKGRHPKNPPGSKADVRFTFTCSDQQVAAIGNTSVFTTGGVVLRFMTRSGSQPAYNSAIEPRRLKDDIVGQKHFKILDGPQQSGDWVAVFCAEESYECTQKQAFDTAVSWSYFNNRGTGVLGHTDYRVNSSMVADLVYGLRNPNDGTIVNTPFSNLPDHSGQNFQSCDESASPLVVDTDNTGLELSPPSMGVYFDIDVDGEPEQISWPISGDLLVLDKNNNGQIDNGSELFGNYSLGEIDTNRTNGFIALQSHDENGDKVIDADDEVFSRLRLWRDKNHNAFVDEGELSSLADAKLASIDLDYRETTEVDQYGNSTRQRSTVKMQDDSLRLIVDIWFKLTEAAQ